MFFFQAGGFGSGIQWVGLTSGIEYPEQETTHSGALNSPTAMAPSSLNAMSNTLP
jgi:hypothetical protein